MIDTILQYNVIPFVKEVGFEIVLKSTVVISIAGMLALGFRRMSAATRYAIWGAGFVILVLLPYMVISLPSWHLEQFSINQQYGEPSHQSKVAVSEVKSVPQEAIQVTGNAGTTSPSYSKGNEGNKGAVSFLKTNMANTIVMALAVLWLVGTLIIFLRLIIHIHRVQQITLRAQGEGQEEISKIAAPVIASLNIKRQVRIVVSDEVSMPFSWGVFEPVIVIPASAKDWPHDRVRSVLLHELAHVARWDYLIHLIVEISCALYWLNPLVWLAAHLSAKERERACDDFALQQGTPSREYASHLLHVARLQLEPCVPITAVTMTAKTGLVERIRYVMNKQLNRSPLSTNKLLLTFVLTLLIAVPIGTLEVVAAKWKIPKTTQLVDALLNSDDSLIRRRAAWWLGEHEDDDGVGPLVTGLRDQSSDVRLASAWALGEIKDEASINPLVRALEDENPLVREMATLALGEIEDPSAVDPLVEVFEREKDIRPAVVWALGEIENNGSRKAGLARKRAFDSLGRKPWRNDEVWTGKLDKHLPQSKNISSIIEQLTNNDADKRRDAALNLGYLGIHHHYESTTEVERVVDALLNTLRDSVPEVRAAAVWALDEINPSRSARKGIFHRH